eukprot:TRINITY_DN8598_c1_g1_i1.p1 TRINITY_DN8598_c1_g1~~TRINITY_DN8598_c1_g1_i1.p1  ORF type:complete len:490 (-),score=57.82 TRINITY_DN8598_c1_g1_i1:137-1606(-)
MAFGQDDKTKRINTKAAIRPPYNVFDYYHTEGFAQRIGRSPYFEYVTLGIVFLNTIWIAIDADHNQAAMLVDADPVFQVAENLFCLYFTGEVVLRFACFQRKCRAFADYWFVFDFILVTLMVAETWIVTIILVAMGARNVQMPGGTSMLRMVRLVKLLRLTRMTKFLRAAPELVIIIKGLAFAARSVCVFFLLWVMIVYVFAILFRQLTDGQAVGSQYFDTVPEAMNTLLLNGVFADNADVMSNMTSGSDGLPWLWPFLIFFFALVSMTIMYMLVGVLVDVIGVVATSEKERLEVGHIAMLLRYEFDKMGRNEDAELTYDDFVSIMSEPSVQAAIQTVGIDVTTLGDMLDIVFLDVAKNKYGTLTFQDLIGVLLNMRGTNPATVKDCKEQIRVTKTVVRQSLSELNTNLEKNFKVLRETILALELDYSDDGSVADMMPSPGPGPGAMSRRVSSRSANALQNLRQSLSGSASRRSISPDSSIHEDDEPNE